MLKKKYSPDYEDGKCPYGFEFVQGYYDYRTHQWVESYCRKIRNRLRDPTKDRWS